MPKPSILLVLGLFLAAGCSDDDDDSGGGDGDADGDGDGDGDVPAECGNGIVDGADECEGPSCDDGFACTDGCTCAPFDEGPATSQDLIEKAYEAGTIDYHTSLMYRVWALFRAPGLPEEYDGVGTRGEDTSLFFEVARERAAFSADIEAAVAPYLVRPDDPASIFSRLTAEIGGGTGTPVLCPANEQGRADWRSSGTDHFVIWSCGGGVAGTDPYGAARVVAGQDFERAYEVLVSQGGLPPPRNDFYSVGPLPQERIDIYLVVPNQCRARHDVECENIIGEELGLSVPDVPCDRSGGPATSSGYILVQASQVPAASGPSPFRNTAAHELFHLIQFALNLEVDGNTCSAGNPSVPAGSDAGVSWLGEATAEWAAHSFFPDDEPERRTRLFEEFQTYRYNPRTGLLATNDELDYNAFLYPAFVEEETGSRDTILNLWKGSQSARSPRDFDDRLDTLFPFEGHFRDFSVRNFNRLLPGGPVLQPHESFDEALPFDREPYLSQVVKPGYRWGGLRYTGEQTLPIRIAPLAMQTDRMELVPELTWIKFDATAVGAGHLRVDALVKVGDSWERRRLTAPVFEMCRDNPADEDIEEVYLIFSNDTHDPGGRIDGLYDVDKGPACPGGWTGRMWIVNNSEEHWAYDDANGHNSLDLSMTTNQEWSIVASRQEDEDEIIDATWSASFDSVRTEVSPNVGCPRTTTTTGTGTGNGRSSFRVLFRGDGTVQSLAPTGENANQGTIESHTDTQDCENSAGYDQPPGILYEAFDLYGTNEFSLLQADPRDPDSFSGSATILHSDDGAGRVTDITGYWELRRTVSGP